MLTTKDLAHVFTKSCHFKFLIIAATSGTISLAGSTPLVEISAWKMKDFSKVMNAAPVPAVRSLAFLAYTALIAL